MDYDIDLFVLNVLKYKNLKLNSNEDLVKNVKEGLKKNFNDYKKFYCPCKIEKNRENICPCLSLQDDIVNKNRCGCRLFVKI